MEGGVAEMAPFTSNSEFIKETFYVCPQNLTADEWSFWLKSVFNNEPRGKLLSYYPHCIHTLVEGYTKVYNTE